MAARNVQTHEPTIHDVSRLATNPHTTSLNFPPNTRGPNVAPNLAHANITQNTLRMPLVQVTNPTALLSKRLTYVCVAAM